MFTSYKEKTRVGKYASSTIVWLAVQFILKKSQHTQEELLYTRRSQKESHILNVCKDVRQALRRKTHAFAGRERQPKNSQLALTVGRQQAIVRNDAFQRSNLQQMYLQLQRVKLPTNLVADKPRSGAAFSSKTDTPRWCQSIANKIKVGSMCCTKKNGWVKLYFIYMKLRHIHHNRLSNLGFARIIIIVSIICKTTTRQFKLCLFILFWLKIYIYVFKWKGYVKFVFPSVQMKTAWYETTV